MPGDGKYPLFQRLVHHFNREFHPQQHWAYGCNCMLMVDESRSMEKTTFGAPVDDLDKTCKRLKDCYKCVREAHGGSCTPEKKEYDIFFRGDDILVGNQPGTCERALFECDQQYAKNLQMALPLFDIRYNFFSGSFDPISEPDVCARGAKPNLPYGIGGVRDIMQPNVQCCASTKGPFQTYNANIKQCCSDGSVRDQCS